jgi:hypothetical protein
MDKSSVLLKYQSLLIKCYADRRKNKADQLSIEKIISQNLNNDIILESYQNSLSQLKRKFVDLDVAISLYEMIANDIRNIHSLN